VLLAYATPDMATLVKQAMGFNFLPRELGEHITESVIQLVLDKKVRPVIGSVVEFEQIPAAIDNQSGNDSMRQGASRMRLRSKSSSTPLGAKSFLGPTR
jgi:NADPH:quinone reductase-like Zn-dependent oxidoreductase